MIVIKLSGGLGNQMFQYAYGRALATEFHKELVLDTEFLLDRSKKENFVFREFDLDLFDLKPYQFFDESKRLQFYKKSWFKRPGIKVQEQTFSYSPLDIDIKKSNIYLDGYWQSFKYFSSIEASLRKEFTFLHSFTEEQINLSEKIKTTTSICINFRRTDFVSIPSAIETHGVTSLTYYYRAIETIKTKVGNDIQLFVFSDDIEWCKVHFKVIDPVFFVSHEQYKGERFSSYLQLMSQCKHFIIPNSTFGWWAAWLSQHQNKIIITPERWFKDEKLQSQTHDLRPNEWLKM
jgi:hypothetical protein